MDSLSWWWGLGLLAFIIFMVWWWRVFSVPQKKECSTCVHSYPFIMPHHDKDAVWCTLKVQPTLKQFCCDSHSF